MSDKRGRSSRPGWQQEIAGERIELLFRQADEEFREHPERSDRYVELARKIGMRYNVRIPKELKVRFCGSCKAFLLPGVNSTVRSSSRSLSMEVKCHKCGETTRMPYSKEKKNKTDAGE